MTTNTNTIKNARWEAIIHRPLLPEGWKCLEQLDRPQTSYISYSKIDKTHHNAQPDRLMVIFCQYAPGTTDHQYSVRGGRNIKPSESLKFFNDLKSATDYMVFLMESTNTWLKEINSEKYINAYNAKIAKNMADIEAYRKKMQEALEIGL